MIAITNKWPKQKQNDTIHTNSKTSNPLQVIATAWCVRDSLYMWLRNSSNESVHLIDLII